MRHTRCNDSQLTFWSQPERPRLLQFMEVLDWPRCGGAAGRGRKTRWPDLVNFQLCRPQCVFTRVTNTCTVWVAPHAHAHAHSHTPTRTSALACTPLSHTYTLTPMMPYPHAHTHTRTHTHSRLQPPTCSTSKHHTLAGVKPEHPPPRTLTTSKRTSSTLTTPEHLTQARSWGKAVVSGLTLSGLRNRGATPALLAQHPCCAERCVQPSQIPRTR